MVIQSRKNVQSHKRGHISTRCIRSFKVHPFVTISLLKYRFGRVFAYEIDGYGSRIVMDDANIPSLLSLPILGFIERTDELYLNTRRMVLAEVGNPYYLRGNWFHGIGGPHIGPKNA